MNQLIKKSILALVLTTFLAAIFGIFGFLQPKPALAQSAGPILQVQLFDGSCDSQQSTAVNIDSNSSWSPWFGDSNDHEYNCIKLTQAGNWKNPSKDYRVGVQIATTSSTCLSAHTRESNISYTPWASEGKLDTETYGNGAGSAYGASPFSNFGTSTDTGNDCIRFIIETRNFSGNPLTFSQVDICVQLSEDRGSGPNFGHLFCANNPGEGSMHRYESSNFPISKSTPGTSDSAAWSPDDNYKYLSDTPDSVSLRLLTWKSPAAQPVPSFSISASPFDVSFFRQDSIGHSGVSSPITIVATCTNLTGNINLNNPTITPSSGSLSGVTVTLSSNSIPCGGSITANIRATSSASPVSVPGSGDPKVGVVVSGYNTNVNGGASQNAPVVYGHIYALPDVQFIGNGSANPTVTSGDPVNLTWNPVNTSPGTECVSGGSWSGNKQSNSGGSFSETLYPTNTTSSNTQVTYTLYCKGGIVSGSGGEIYNSSTKTVTVTVKPRFSSPTVTASFNPKNIQTGQNTTFSWNATNASTCEVFNQSNGSLGAGKPASGSVNASFASAGTFAYSVECKSLDPAGIPSARDSDTVIVTATPPVATNVTIKVRATLDGQPSSSPLNINYALNRSNTSGTLIPLASYSVPRDHVVAYSPALVTYTLSGSSSSTTLPTPPVGYKWGSPAITPNPTQSQPSTGAPTTYTMNFVKDYSGSIIDFDFNFTPNQIVVLGSTNLSWNQKPNSVANKCELFNWNGSTLGQQSLSGSMVIPFYSAGVYDFKMTCSGPSGTSAVTKTARITVAPMPASVYVSWTLDGVSKSSKLSGVSYQLRNSNGTNLAGSELWQVFPSVPDGSYSIQNLTVPNAYKVDSITPTSQNAYAIQTIYPTGGVYPSGAGTITFTVNLKTQVTKSLTGLRLDPANTTIFVGNTQSYLVTALYSDGSTADVTFDSGTQFSTVPDPSGIATIGKTTAKNVALGLTSGSIQIKATYGGMTATANLNVTNYNGTLSCPTVTPVVGGQTVTFAVSLTKPSSAFNLTVPFSNQLTGPRTLVVSSNPSGEFNNATGYITQFSIPTQSTTVPESYSLRVTTTAVNGLSSSTCTIPFSVNPTNGGTIDRIEIEPKNQKIVVSQSQTYSVYAHYVGTPANQLVLVDPALVSFANPTPTGVANRSGAVYTGTAPGVVSVGATYAGKTATPTNLYITDFKGACTGCAFRVYKTDPDQNAILQLDRLPTAAPFDQADVNYSVFIQDNADSYKNVLGDAQGRHAYGVFSKSAGYPSIPMLIQSSQLTPGKTYTVIFNTWALGVGRTTSYEFQIAPTQTANGSLLCNLASQDPVTVGSSVTFDVRYTRPSGFTSNLPFSTTLTGPSSLVAGLNPASPFAASTGDKTTVTINTTSTTIPGTYTFTLTTAPTGAQGQLSCSTTFGVRSASNPNGTLEIQPIDKKIVPKENPTDPNTSTNSVTYTTCYRATANSLCAPVTATFNIPNSAIATKSGATFIGVGQGVQTVTASYNPPSNPGTTITVSTNLYVQDFSPACSECGFTASPAAGQSTVADRVVALSLNRYPSASPYDQGNVSYVVDIYDTSAGNTPVLPLVGGHYATGTFTSPAYANQNLTLKLSQMTLNHTYRIEITATGSGITRKGINQFTLGNNSVNPGNPNSLTGSAAQCEKASLSWTAPSSGASFTNYRIYRKTTNSSYSIAGTVGTNPTSYTDNVAAGSYTYMVKAVSAGGAESNPSNEINLDVTACPPGGPNSLSASQQGCDIILSWSAPSSGVVIKYNIYRSSVSGSLGSLIGTVNAPTVSYSDTSLNTAGFFYYTIKAVSTGNAESVGSNQVGVGWNPCLPNLGNSNKRVIEVNGVKNSNAVDSAGNSISPCSSTQNKLDLKPLLNQPVKFAIHLCNSGNYDLNATTNPIEVADTGLERLTKPSTGWGVEWKVNGTSIPCAATLGSGIACQVTDTGSGFTVKLKGAVLPKLSGVWRIDFTALTAPAVAGEAKGPSFYRNRASIYFEKPNGSTCTAVIRNGKAYCEVIVDTGYKLFFNGLSDTPRMIEISN